MKRRIGRRSRLADLKRAFEHGERRELGLVSSRRRRRHGYSLHAGQVSVADGTDEAAKRLNRVLTNDPGIGVARHVDAGYEAAEKTAREKGVKIPMLRRQIDVSEKPAKRVKA